ARELRYTVNFIYIHEVLEYHFTFVFNNFSIFSLTLCLVSFVVIFLTT
ncbi:MAG: hypothetical protein RL727_950, partial [Pseudomonadota bacterium]